MYNFVGKRRLVFDKLSLKQPKDFLTLEGHLENKTETVRLPKSSSRKRNM